MLPDLDVAAVPRAALPALLGRLTELEARVRLRLAEPGATPVAASRRLTADEGAALVGCSARWLSHATRGHRCRRDLSRKRPGFDEHELRVWLAQKCTG